MIAHLLHRLAKAQMNYQHPFGLLAQRLLGRRIVTVTDRATGLRFRCRRGADRMLGEIFHSQIYDIPTAPVESGDVVVDVGANHGFTSCYFAQRGATVIAFEPDPATYGFLEANVAANRLTDRIRTFPSAVAGQEGIARLQTADELGGGMSTLNDQFANAHGLTITGTVSVRTESLPAIFSRLELDRVRLLKLDCEGSELDILRSLDPATREKIDSLAIEYHPEAYPLTELVDVLLGWTGFQLSKVVTQEVTNANLNVVSERAMREWARGTRTGMGCST
ncbi:MAG TPA: FkbM family methyltransferase [Thermoanaerobaculia bacterium]|nr:FkbM family methyltransferase [Thermoanaerobaculia bacterium]